MTGPAFVSIIIVNYNGKHYLPACLDALKQQTYPGDCFEVIVSDNASRDGSLEFLREQYPWVRVLANQKNLGFSGGNNVAIRQARGKYIILLNNDTVPSPVWLEEMVAAANAVPEAGLVTGHLQLFYNQLEVTLAVDGEPPGSEGRSPLRIYEVNSGAQRGIVQYLEGFSGLERDESGALYRQASTQSLLGLPIPPGPGEIPVQCRMASDKPVRVSLSAGGIVYGEWLVDLPKPEWFSAAIPEGSRTLSLPLEQNTGSIVFHSGAGRDRGTYVTNTDVFFEKSEGQYSRREEVFAGCGASLLLKREMLDDAGLLDDRFFMYYEDTDLAWRARIRGWKVLYAPDALVRHIHCGTTKEWSPFFIYLIERNRLVMVFKNGGLRQVLRVWGGYCFKVARLGWRTVKKMLKRKPDWRMGAGEMRIHLRVLWSLLVWQPVLWVRRSRVQSRRAVSVESIETWFARVE